MDKAEKIKAAKKKLKEFQSHKKDDNKNISSDDIRPEGLVQEVKKSVNTDTIEEKDSEYIPRQSLISSYFDTSTNNTNSFMSAFHPDYAQNNQNLDYVPTTSSNNSQQMISNEHLNGNSDVRELQGSIDQQNLLITQLKSEVEFHRTTATNLQKNLDELNRLKQQEKLHTDTVKVLVTEKSNLMDTLQKSEFQIQELKNENEELHNRLNLSRHRVKQLESQHTQNPVQKEEDTKKAEQVMNERMKELNDSLRKVESERSELKLLLDQQRIEMENLQRNFDHINTELHLATVKIAQLSDDTQTNQPQAIINDSTLQPQLHSLSQELAIKQQQINELNSIIDQLNNERDANETQYQNYVSSMSSEMKELKERSIELTNENDSLIKREQELLKNVSDLERQMQHQIQKQKIYTEQNTAQDRAANLSDIDVEKINSQIAALTSENESIKSQLSQLEQEKLTLKKSLDDKIEEVQGLEFQVDKMRTITPNVTQLMADFEDKSTAASRALTQNQSLKDQLEELQRAFVNISNDKMELTDKLQSEFHLCKEMKSQYDLMESELSNMKEKWQFKENEMIRLSHENTELEKKILQQNIEIDRLRHYESKDYHGADGIIERELDHYKHLVETLTNKINVLEGREIEHNHEGHGHSHSHDDHDGHGHSHSHDGHSHEHSNDSPMKKSPQHCDASKKHLLDEIEMLKMEKNELIKAINDFQMTRKSSKDQQKDEEQVNEQGKDTEPEEMTDEKLKKMDEKKPIMSVTPSIATEEALEKLQSRFRRTMLEVADLTEEKNRLEHLVTQLQFETETIGEYITLYQNQRRLLKQKELERDIQLKNLAADRGLMNEKLCQLNGLIEKFVLQHSDQHTEIANEAAKLIESESVISEPVIFNAVNTDVDFEKLKKETAGKILEILSDIKTTNTRSYGSNIGIEHCACCYGELKTV